MGELFARIRSDGPIRSRDIETNTKKRAGWWDWKPAKKALEQLYMQGDLMVSNREGFQKTYDLTERVLASHVNSQMPNVEELAAHLVGQQLRCHAGHFTALFPHHFVHGEFFLLTLDPGQVNLTHLRTHLGAKFGDGVGGGDEGLRRRQSGHRRLPGSHR